MMMRTLITRKFDEYLTLQGRRFLFFFFFYFFSFSMIVTFILGMGMYKASNRVDLSWVCSC